MYRDAARIAGARTMLEIDPSAMQEMKRLGSLPELLGDVKAQAVVGRRLDDAA